MYIYIYGSKLLRIYLFMYITYILSWYGRIPTVLTCNPGIMRCVQVYTGIFRICKGIVRYTGCAVALCSAISQASCRSPDDRRGADLPQEDVGEHVGLNYIQKVFRKGANGNHSGQTPRGSGAPLPGFSRRRFCNAVWGRRRVLFFK
jgi:hypothetical protein